MIFYMLFMICYVYVSEKFLIMLSNDFLWFLCFCCFLFNQFFNGFFYVLNDFSWCVYIFHMFFMIVCNFLMVI